MLKYVFCLLATITLFGGFVSLFFTFAYFGYSLILAVVFIGAAAAADEFTKMD